MVLKSGHLWGKSPRITAGGGPECVKAFLGPLPSGLIGYTFMTEVAPTRHRNFGGIEGAVWEEGTAGVMPVPNRPDFVQIPVRIINV